MKMDRSRLWTVFRMSVGIRESSAFFGIFVAFTECSQELAHFQQRLVTKILGSAFKALF
jgi:hypothetical protein